MSFIGYPMSLIIQALARPLLIPAVLVIGCWTGWRAHDLAAAEPNVAPFSPHGIQRIVERYAIDDLRTLLDVIDDRLSDFSEDP